MRHSKVVALLVLAGALLVTMPSVGRADPIRTILAYQLDGGAITQLVSSTSSLATLVYSGQIAPGLFVNIDSTSEVNGATSSGIFSSTTGVDNFDTATHTLSLWASSIDFTMPTATNLTSSSGAGGGYISYFGTASAGVTFQAWADANNGLLAGAPTYAAASSTNGLQFANPASGTNGTWDTGEASSPFTRGPGNYSMTVVTNLTLQAGTGVGYVNHQIVAAPEPATLALLGLGLIALGVGKRRVI